VRPKYIVFGLTLPTILVLDVLTKRWALEALEFESRELFGGLLPLTLAFNKGAAFGMSIGDDSRWFFIPVTAVALVLLGVLLKQADRRDFLRIISISLVVSGAVGNLYDRVRWGRGVVDFLGPVDLGLWLFPIFNVADMAITCGAILLAISFWFEERDERASAEAAAGESPAGAPAQRVEASVEGVEASVEGVEASVEDVEASVESGEASVESDGPGLPTDVESADPRHEAAPSQPHEAPYTSPDSSPAGS
jgi:signal peptidase II